MAHASITTTSTTTLTIEQQVIQAIKEDDHSPFDPQDLDVDEDVEDSKNFDVVMNEVKQASQEAIAKNTIAQYKRSITLLRYVFHHSSPVY